MGTNPLEERRFPVYMNAERMARVEPSATLLLVGEQCSAVLHMLPALTLFSEKVFVGPSPTREILVKALAETNPALIIASSDFDYTQLGALKNSRRIKKLVPPVLLCVTHESLEDDDLYEGIDDFLVVPCSAREMEKRMRRLVRNGDAHSSSTQIQLGLLSLDTSSYRVLVDGKPVRLTWMEFQLLSFLMQNPRRVFTREQLIKSVWGSDYFGYTRTVDVHIRRLRHKLGAARDHIRTISHVGYGLTEP